MSDEIEFVNGLSVKPRHDKTPDYVLANGSINCEQMAEFIKGRTGYVNWQARLSKGGKSYVAVDTWKPDSQRQSRPSQDSYQSPSEGFDDDLPPF